jgi:hypothetical protein
MRETSFVVTALRSCNGGGGCDSGGRQRERCELAVQGLTTTRQRAASSIVEKMTAIPGLRTKESLIANQLRSSIPSIPSPHRIANPNSNEADRSSIGIASVHRENLRDTPAKRRSRKRIQ